MLQSAQELKNATIIEKLEAQRALDNKSMSAFAAELGVSRMLYNLVAANSRPFGPKLAMGVSQRYPHWRDEAFAFVGKKADGSIPPRAVRNKAA